MPVDCDVLIAGAGCAGLSLAVHLMDVGATDLEVVLLEPREAHVRDRTWCYWALFDHPFEAAASHTWFRWSVITDEGAVEQGSSSLGYRCLPANGFYDLAFERLRRHSNVRLVRGVSVESFREERGTVTAHTTDGDIRCRLAFDSRPRERRPVARRAAARGEIDWVQHFVGLEVETANEVFDPSVATLMDFRAGAHDGIRFMYVLPFDGRRALLEDTFFGGEVLPEASYVDAIRGYLVDRLGSGGWREVHRERGVIPMSTLPPRPSPWPRVTDLGVRAGLARPSTGYAFLAVQRQARWIAERVASGGVGRPIPRRRPHSRSTAFLDRVFLAYLEREPGAAPEMFRRMFGGVSPDRMARFLFDGGSLGDRLSVMRELPAGPLAQDARKPSVATTRGAPSGAPGPGLGAGQSASHRVRAPGRAGPSIGWLVRRRLESIHRRSPPAVADRGPGAGGVARRQRAPHSPECLPSHGGLARGGHGHGWTARVFVAWPRTGRRPSWSVVSARQP